MSPDSQTPSLSCRLFSWRPGAYLRASVDLLGWLLVRAAAQVTVVLLFTRTLGANDYGQFVAILAVAGFFTPLAGLGLGSVFLRDGARFPERLPELLGDALALWWRSTVIFALVAVGATLWLLPTGIDAAAVSAFAVGEVASGSLSELIARVEQSQHQTRFFGAILSGLILVRLVALAGYATLATPDVSGWLWVYAGSSGLYTLALLVWMQARWRPKRSKTLAIRLVREGWPFTIGALSFRLQAEFNKPVLAQLGYAQAGYFSAAQRVVDLASLPLQAMQEALWSRLYASSSPARRLWLTGGVLVTLALLGGSVLTWLAPWAPRIFGEGFEGAVEVLRVLAWLPAVQVVRNLANAAVIARGQHAFLTQVYIASGIASIVFNSLLVPCFGLPGALWSAYLSEMVALAVLYFPLTLSRQESPL